MVGSQESQRRADPGAAGRATATSREEELPGGGAAGRAPRLRDERRGQPRCHSARAPSSPQSCHLRPPPNSGTSSCNGCVPPLNQQLTGPHQPMEPRLPTGVRQGRASCWENPSREDGGYWDKPADGSARFFLSSLPPPPPLPTTASPGSRRQPAGRDKPACCRVESGGILFLKTRDVRNVALWMGGGSTRQTGRQAG